MSSSLRSQPQYKDPDLYNSIRRLDGESRRASAAAGPISKLTGNNAGPGKDYLRTPSQHEMTMRNPPFHLRELAKSSIFRHIDRLVLVLVTIRFWSSLMHLAEVNRLQSGANPGSWISCPGDS